MDLWRSLCTLWLFSHLPGESYWRWFRSLLLCWCDVFPARINSLSLLVLDEALTETKQQEQQRMKMCMSVGAVECYFWESFFCIWTLYAWTLCPDCSATLCFWCNIICQGHEKSFQRPNTASAPLCTDTKMLKWWSMCSSSAEVTKHVQ